MITFIPNSAGQYQALSTDIWSGCATPGISYIGADVYLTDTQEWKRVLPDLTLGSKSQQVTMPVLNASSGSLTGMHWISSSAVTVSGPNVTNRNGFFIEGYPGNTGYVYFTNANGTSGCGYYLGGGQQVLFTGSALSALVFGGTTSGCVCWFKV